MKHQGIETLDEVFNNDLRKNLETLAELKEENITILENGFKFTFERSLRTNFCRVVNYHDNIIVEFRKVTDNPIQGKTDKLVFEDVIKKHQFKDIFEKVTGIYVSYLDEK